MSVPIGKLQSGAVMNTFECNQAPLASQNAVPLSQGSGSTFPQHVPSPAAAARTTTAVPATEIESACWSVHRRIDGILDYAVQEYGDALANKSCSLTVTLPTGISRTYLTRAEHMQNVDAEAAAARFALAMGVVGFLQHGDDADRGALESAREISGVDEEDDSIVHTSSGQVYVNLRPADGGSCVTIIGRSCAIATDGRVVPYWAPLTKFERVEGTTQILHGYVLFIKINATIMQAWSVPCVYAGSSDALDALSKMVIRPALEFIHSRGGLAQGFLPSSPSTHEYALALSNASSHVPNGVTLDGSNNAADWVSLMTSGCKAEVDLDFIVAQVGSSNTGTIGCVLRITPLGSKKNGWRSWFSQPLFKSRREARDAVFFQVVACGGLDSYLSPYLQSTIGPPLPDLSSPDIQKQHEIASFERACTTCGAIPKFDITFHDVKQRYGGTLTVTAGERGYWKYVARSKYRDQLAVKTALIARARGEQILFQAFRAVSDKKEKQLVLRNALAQPHRSQAGGSS